jgi:DNA-binding IclR family transcriptional regulator
MSPIAAAVQLLREVYLEAPASRLSARDAAQLSGLEPSTCQIILEVLADARFLSRSPEGVFVRRAEPPAKRAS